MPEPPPRYHEALESIVDGIEGELRRTGLWERQRPPTAALASGQPFCYDSLVFPQWLQWVFVPRIRGVLNGLEPLPVDSCIEPYAAECLDSLGGDGDQLLFLLRSFDELISMQSVSA